MIHSSVADQDLEGNIRSHEEYARVDPNNAHLQLTLGECYHKAGRLDDALTCYRRCLELHPNDVRAPSRSALVLISQHRFSEAEQLIQDLLNSSETDAALWHNLGIAQYHQHRWHDAAA